MNNKINKGANIILNTNLILISDMHPAKEYLYDPMWDRTGTGTSTTVRLVLKVLKVPVPVL